jgi:predicted nucleic-acid-binding protein
VRGLDANVLLRLLLADDARQAARAREWLHAEPRGQRLLINRIVLCELVWTLRRGYRFDREQIAEVIVRLLKSHDILVEDYDSVVLASDLYRTSAADFADCLLGVTNRVLGCSATGTFDRDAAELDAFELIPA